MASNGGGAKELTPESIAGRLGGLDRWQITNDATRLTAFIDCGKKVHWFAVIAWNESFGGHVVAYGAWPSQNRSFFAADDARPTLSDVFPKITKDDQLVYAGLVGLTAEILGRTYYRENGEPIGVERCMIDSGWETDAVYQFCRRSDFSAILHPSKGIGRTTSARGVGEWAAKPGERKGYHWRLAARERLVQFDPDVWKSIAFGLIFGFVAFAVSASPSQYARTPSVPHGVVSSLGNVIELPETGLSSHIDRNESSDSA
jgi:hypothetical protein